MAIKAITSSPYFQNAVIGAAIGTVILTSLSDPENDLNMEGVSLSSFDPVDKMSFYSTYYITRAFRSAIEGAVVGLLHTAVDKIFGIYRRAIFE